jgi:DNA-binding response OmpR family regulator
MNDRSARGPRILIVEDEPLIAIELEFVLREANFEIADITGKLERALLAIEGGTCDAAVLDANLEGISAAPVAIALASRGLPFLVLSGYASAQQPEALRAAPCLQKPADPAQIVKLLNQILAEI